MISNVEGFFWTNNIIRSGWQIFQQEILQQLYNTSGGDVADNDCMMM